MSKNIYFIRKEYLKRENKYIALALNQLQYSLKHFLINICREKAKGGRREPFEALPYKMLKSRRGR